MNIVKQDSARIKDKPYFHKRMYKVMLTHFYMVCAILKENDKITPAFTQREMRDVMHSPLNMPETLSLKGWRMKNLFLYLLGVLPPSLSLTIIRKVGKYKGLI